MGMGRCKLLDQSQVPGGETEERSLLMTRGVRGEQGRWEGNAEHHPLPQGQQYFK